MNLFSVLKLGLGNLTANKMRSALTMLGIIIGIGAVIVVVSVGAGAQSLITNQIKSVGSNLIAVLPGGSEENGPPATVMGIIITTLILDDAEALAGKANVPHAVAVAPYTRGVGTVSWRNKDVDTSFLGTTSGVVDVEDLKLDTGRFISPEESKSVARVAVLGYAVSENLFDGADPVGQNIKIKQESFKVVGVLEKRGVTGFVNQDDQIYVPVMSAQKLLLGINYLNFIRIKVDEGSYVDQTTEDIKLVLRYRHKIPDPAQDDFSVQSQQQGLNALMQVTDALKLFLVAIAAISLVVGGIGIMNIMLIVVNERIREIGLRKAVGATYSVIVRQFLMESALISFLGGIVGIFSGVVISVLVAAVAVYLGYSWDLVISWQSIVLASAVAVAVGLVFGIYPANKAAKLSAIEALRYE